MSRVLLATLFASALVLNAWSATATAGTASIEAVKTVAAGNHPALPPGGAAGIKKAQGLDGYWREAALVIGAFVVLFLLIGIDGGDDDDTPTTGT